VPVDWVATSLPVDAPPIALAPRVMRCFGGQHWEWDGVRFAMLYPRWESYNLDGVSENAHSCVLKIDSPYGGILLPADIEQESETELIASSGRQLPADVMVAIWNEDSIAESIKLAQELRAAGLRVDLYPEADKLGKQFKYASSRAVSFVAVVGDEERARGEVAIKDLRSGEQQSIKRASVAAELRRKLVLP